MESQLEILVFIIGFVVISLSSREIGQYFVKLRLPLISGFLFTGIIAGPFVLGLISADSVKHLGFIDELSLAVIAFAAGSELFLKDLRSRFRSIRWVTIGLVLSTFTITSVTVYMLADFIPFMRTMPESGRVAVAILAGAILVARSPSSAIAVVNELRARGPFTQTVLGVTVIMDVVVITVFAVNSSVADALLTGLTLDLSFVMLFIAELSLSLALGYVLAKVLQLILSFPIDRLVKTGLVLLGGYGVFALSAWIRHATHARFAFEVLLEPLLICMIGSFLTTNYSNYRGEFTKLLHDVALPVYVAFFTLTGASLQLDILASTWQIAIALFAVRVGAIFLGSFAGGTIAGDPLSHNRVSWMSYITQAGVGLGLAKEVAVEFPEWGTALATIIISVIVLNQIIGPPLFKWAVHLVGEAHTRAEPHDFSGPRDAIIFGIEGQSLALARQLLSHGWQVKVVSRKVDYVKEIGDQSDIDIHAISSLDFESLKGLQAGQAEAIVALLSDEENYKISELAYEHFGTENVIVRLNDRANLGRFHELGVLIVDPATAIVNLLDHFVRSPSAASLLLGMEQDQSVIDLEVRNANLHGVAIRDLRLPLDVHILSVHRKGHMLISHGYTRLELGDQVSVVGSVTSLEHLSLRFDTNREYELLDIVGRVTPAQLATRSIETEVKEIIREKTGVRRSRFDELVEQSTVMDIPQSISMEAFFHQVADEMAAKVNVEPAALFDLLMEREKEHSTAITPGLAIPHIIIEGEHTFNILLARCREGITFSEAAPKVQVIFVLIGTSDERNFHLRALSSIAELVGEPHFENRWLRARSETALRNVVLMRKGTRHA